MGIPQKLHASAGAGQPENGRRASGRPETGRPEIGPAKVGPARRRRSGDAWRSRRRLCFALAAVAFFCVACSSDTLAPGETSAPASATPSVVTTEAHAEEPLAEALLPREATELRPVTAGDGSYPAADEQQPLPALEAAFDIGGGRIWVPWPPYTEPDDVTELAETGHSATGQLEAGHSATEQSEPAASANGPAATSQPETRSQSALVNDVAAGQRYVVEQRQQWSAMPPYLPEAQAALDRGERVARRRAGTESAWELVIDTADLDYETRLSADRSEAYDHAALCPPHPTPETLKIDVGEDAQQRSQAAAVIEAFIVGMRSPGGRPMHSWGTTINEVAKLLVYSPGEPMELALGGHSLTDMGFFPGDWSDEAKHWLTVRAAQGAVTDSLVGHAAISSGPDTLWEACSDLATIVPGVYTNSHRTRQLESLWARGLRLEFTSPPVERAWVADISTAGHALAVICHAPGQSFLVDASSGERLDVGTDHPAQVEAMWLTWSRLSYRVLRNELFDGDCDSDAFEEAVQWLAAEQETHAASIDWTEPRAWASGVRNQWIAVREWVDVPQPEAWTAHRSHLWHLALWCETGIPIGTLVGEELRRPELAPYCTPAQWTQLSQSAAAAPQVTTELSATNWEPDASWYERMYLSPFKSLEELLGCSADADLIAEALARPVERRTKKPWPPGSLPLTEAPRAYPRPTPPCPAAGWPPQTDRYWWPATVSLAQAESLAHAEFRAQAESLAQADLPEGDGAP